MIKKLILPSLLIFSALSSENVNLIVPKISKENITQVVTGYRPIRKSGVRIEKEQIEDKLFIHNYGYGGSGLTLALGGAAEVLNLIKNDPNPIKTVAVLGAGVAGLTTAYELLEQGYEVHIYADNWSPKLTSNIGAGIWTALKACKDYSEEQVKLHEQILETAKNRLLPSTENGKEFKGVTVIPHYRFLDEGKEEFNSTYLKGKKILARFDNGFTREGVCVEKLHIDGKLFLEDLFKKIQEKGASLYHMHFSSLDELLQIEEELIVNCSSIGAKSLFQDDDLYESKGYLIYFEPDKSINYVYSFPSDLDSQWTALNPWEDRLILGGVTDAPELSQEEEEELISQLVENAQNCFKDKFLTSGGEKMAATAVNYQNQVFYPLPKDIENKILGNSFIPVDQRQEVDELKLNKEQLQEKVTSAVGLPENIDQLAYLQIYHYDFEGRVVQGELICNKNIADKVNRVFQELFKIRFPITSMKLMEDFKLSDDNSMLANNSSCLCMRSITNKPWKWSNHSFGLAIDINPFLNPYFKEGYPVEPKGSEKYLDRNLKEPGVITPEIVEIFKKEGFEWGGDWKSLKDYMHFEYPKDKL